jgi:crotonobetainyl-CoA:carnitine CoA-transferase CaiB-like acyl-CoA transferase
VELLGHDEWVERRTDPTLREEFQDLIVTRPLEHWAGLLERPDTCVTAVRDIADIPKDPQIRARGALIARDSPVGLLPQVASPFHPINPTTKEN